MSLNLHIQYTILTPLLLFYLIVSKHSITIPDNVLRGSGEEPEEQEFQDEEEPQPDDHDLDDDTDNEQSLETHILVLDSPFATFRGMIHDVIKSQYNVSGCCINIALSGVLKGCKKIVDRDLTTIKPIEAVPFVEIPTFYMVGKQDIIARPEKVKNLFLNTNTAYKEFWTFAGQHNSPRDRNALRNAVLFVMEHLQRLNDVAKDIKTKKPPKIKAKERERHLRVLEKEFMLEGNNFLKQGDIGMMKVKRFGNKNKSKSKSGAAGAGATTISDSKFSGHDDNNVGGFEKVSQPSINASKPPQPSINDDPPMNLDQISQNLTPNYHKKNNNHQVKSELDETQSSKNPIKKSGLTQSLKGESEGQIPALSLNKPLGVGEEENLATQEGSVVKNELAKMDVGESDFQREDFRKENLDSEPNLPGFEDNHMGLSGGDNLEIDRKEFTTLGDQNWEDRGLERSKVGHCILF